MTSKNHNQLISKQVITLPMYSFTNYIGIPFPTFVCSIRSTIITQESPIKNAQVSLISFQSLIKFQQPLQQLNALKQTQKKIQYTINLKTYRETYQNHIRLRLSIIDFVIIEETLLKRHLAINKLSIEKPIQSIQIRRQVSSKCSNNRGSNWIRVYVCVYLLQFIPILPNIPTITNWMN